MTWRPHTHCKATLDGWVKWVVALSIPFCALAFDTWLNTETLRHDYEAAQINNDLKRCSETIEALRVDETQLERLDRIECEAPNLGLVEPQPGQVEVIRYAENGTFTEGLEAPYVVARLEEETLPPAHPNGSWGHASMMKQHEARLWDISSLPTPVSITPMGDLLRKALFAAYVSYRGDSLPSS